MSVEQVPESGTVSAISRSLPLRSPPFAADAGGGQIDVGEHRQGDVPVTGGVVAHLVGGQTGLLLGGGEALLDAPAAAGHRDELLEGGRGRSGADVIGQLGVLAGVGGDAAAGQQPAHLGGVAIFPVVPVHCRATPAEPVPFLMNPVSTTMSTPPGPSRSTTYEHSTSLTSSAFQSAVRSSRCKPPEETSPTASASVQPFLRSSCPSRPRRYASTPGARLGPGERAGDPPMYFLQARRPVSHLGHQLLAAIEGEEVGVTVGAGCR